MEWACGGCTGSSTFAPVSSSSTGIASRQPRVLATSEEVREAAVIAESLIHPIRATRPVYATHELELDDMVMPLLDVSAVVSETLERSNAGNRGLVSNEQRIR